MSKKKNKRGKKSSKTGKQTELKRNKQSQGKRAAEAAKVEVPKTDASKSISNKAKPGDTTESKKTVQLSENKILLEKAEYKYGGALRSRYGHHTVKVARPLFFLIKVFLAFAMFIALSLATLFVVFGRDLPDVSQLKDMDFSETTVIYDREGNILYRIFSEENRKYVPLSQMDPDAVHATLSIEDKNFYNHPGFDALGMVRAQLKNLEEEDIKQGASTITQQLAKNIFLSPERTYERKVKEFLLSLQIESMFTKDEILEMYLNKIPYGSNAYGIEAASKTFFGKSADDLTIAESAVLASLPKAPSYFSPYGQNGKELMGWCKKPESAESRTELPVQPTSGEDSEILPGEIGDAQVEGQAKLAEKPPMAQLAEELQNTQGPPATSGPETPDIFICTSPDDPNYMTGRKDLVLQRMVEDGYITKEQSLQAWKESFEIEFKSPVHKIESEHFVFYVREYLEKKYGKEMVESGGLEVVTSLDPKMQSLAEEIIHTQASENLRKYGANNASMVALDPRTGQVLAMVGSVDYWDPEIDGQVNVATSPRQPGSSFKPLVYAAAIQNGGIGSGTILSDSKTVFEKNYVPRNSDNTYKGKMSVRSALAMSRNIPAIKAFYIAGGEDKLLDFMDKIGVTTLRKFKDEFNQQAAERGWTFTYGPAMAIGSGEITLLELVGGYAALANGGKHMEINPILEIRDRDGNVIESFEPKGEQAMDPQSAYIVNNILSDVYARPGGSWRASLTIAGKTVAAKTGTSNKKVGKTNYPNNLLTIGYTPSIAAGFWTGNTNGDRLYYNAWGLTASAPMWKSFMEQVLADKPDEPFDVPEGIIWKGREAYPSFMADTNYEKLFKSEEKEEDEEEEVEKDEAGVPLDTFVGEKLEEKTLDDLENEDMSVDVPESDFTIGNEPSVPVIDTGLPVDTTIPVPDFTNVPLPDPLQIEKPADEPDYGF